MQNIRLSLTIALTILAIPACDFSDPDILTASATAVLTTQSGDTDDTGGSSSGGDPKCHEWGHEYGPIEPAQACADGLFMVWGADGGFICVPGCDVWCGETCVDSALTSCNDNLCGIDCEVSADCPDGMICDTSTQGIQMCMWLWVP